MILNQLIKSKKITPPDFVADNTQYLVYIGSRAYGVNNEDSDYDMYGWTIPPKKMIFPHLDGEILGFGRENKRFEVYQHAHVFVDDKEYDFQIFNIVKFFQLLMENNPNILETLYVPINCVAHTTNIGSMVRERRRDFLHKGVYTRMLAYAKSQIHKAEKNDAKPGSKRYDLIQKMGYDSKFLYHTYRLVTECEQLLETGDMDLQLYKEAFKAIRRGDMNLQDVKDWFTSKEKYVQELYQSCTFLPNKPDEEKIKQLLLDCLEHHYGSLANAITIPTAIEAKLKKINEYAEEIRKLSNE